MIEFAQPQSGPGAEKAAEAYGALQTKLATLPTQKDVFASEQLAYRNLFGAQDKAQGAIFGAQTAAQRDIYNTEQNAALQYGLGDQRAAAAADQQAMQAEIQGQRDERLQGYQAEQDDRTQQNRIDFAERQSQLQAELSQTQLTQGETLRMQRLQNATDYIDNDPSLGPIGEDTEDRANARLQVNTGVNRLQQRSQRAQAIASELQLQQLQQQQALADAMGIEGDQARTEAWMRRNSFTDPSSGIRYGLDRNGQIAGQFDAETGEFVPTGLQSTRERAAQQQQQREEQQQQQEQIRAERQEAQRATQLAGALQTAESSLRSEYQKYSADFIRTAGATKPPKWIQDELDLWNENIPKEDGTPWKIEDLTAEDLDRLVNQTATARVRRTHGSLFPTTIDPEAWRVTGTDSAFPGTSPSGGGNGSPVQNAVDAVAAQAAARARPNVAFSPSGEASINRTLPSAQRVNELRAELADARNSLSEDERNAWTYGGLRMTTDSTLSRMRAILVRASDEGRGLTPQENLDYRYLLSVVQSRQGGTDTSRRPDPGRFPRLTP